MAETIWQVPAYSPYLQPKLTARIVRQAEKQLGFPLPKEYLDLLKKQSGGYIRFTLPEIVHQVIAGIGPYFPSLMDFDWEDVQEYVSYDLHGLIPFDGDGHWHLCLDYRKNAKVPSVTYVDIECDSQKPIADSFSDYLNQLEYIVEDELVLEVPGTIKNAKSRLSKILDITFERPDRWGHGYPIYRALFGSKTNREWLWLSPNLVPRGFVRKRDPRYAELKDLMPGEARRYPECPESCCILSLTDGIRSKVLKTCRESGLVLRPLREYLR